MRMRWGVQRPRAAYCFPANRSRAIIPVDAATPTATPAKRVETNYVAHPPRIEAL